MKAFFLNLNHYIESKKYNIFEKDIYERNMQLLSEAGIEAFSLDESTDCIKEVLWAIEADPKLNKNFNKLIELGFYNFASNIVRAKILAENEEFLYLDYDTMLRYYSLDCIKADSSKMRFDSYEYNGEITAQLNIMYSGRGNGEFFKAMVDVYRELDIQTLRDAYDEDVVIATQKKSGIKLSLEDRIMVTHLCIGKNFKTENVRVVITDKAGPETLAKCHLKENEGLIILSAADYDPAWVWDSRPYTYFMFEIPKYYYQKKFFDGLFWQVSNKVVDDTLYLPEGCVEVKNIYLGDLDE